MTSLRRSIPTLFAVGALLAGCGGNPANPPRPDAEPLADLPTMQPPVDRDLPDGGPPDQGATPDAADGPAPDRADGATGEIVWSACPLDPQSSLMAECTTLQVPADYEQPNGPTIPFFVKRYRSRPDATPAPSQLWFLNGGPGGPGSSFAPIVDGLAGMGIEHDYYLPDHRGTGDSGFLDCPGAQNASSFEEFGRLCAAELQAQWGDALPGFTTSNSARDVGFLIERTRAAGQGVVIYGGSYGSYWAHRYLQIFPDQSDGVLMDGLCISETCKFDRIDKSYDDSGRNVLNACAADAFCSSKLSMTPATRLEALLTLVDGGHCSQLGLTGRNDVRSFLSTLGVIEKTLIPPTIYRLERCNEQDQAALIQMAQLISQIAGGFSGPDPMGTWHRRAASEASSMFGGGGRGGFSTALQLHVALSDLWSEPAPTRDAIAAVDATLLFSTQSALGNFDLRQTWPIYPRDPYMDQWATTATPVLMVSGALDFQTSYQLGQAALPHLTTPNFQYLTMPGGDHGVFFASECGLDLFVQFTGAPSAPVDSSCLAQIPPINFDLPADLSQQIFGTASAWENP